MFIADDSARFKNNNQDKPTVQMSVKNQADGMWRNRGGPLRSLPSLIEVENELDIVGPRP
jgi:hypothetical protein